MKPNWKSLFETLENTPSHKFNAGVDYNENGAKDVEILQAKCPDGTEFGISGNITARFKDGIGGSDEYGRGEGIATLELVEVDRVKIWIEKDGKDAEFDEFQIPFVQERKINAILCNKISDAI